jgi:hypothetical protein
MFFHIASADQEGTPRLDFSEPAIPQPQGLCGYCHILTYPAIIQKSFTTWNKGKHNKVGCVDCHYPPEEVDEKGSALTIESKPEKNHIPLETPSHISYLKLGGETIKTKPTIVNASCTTTVCHGKPDDNFRTKKIKFSDKVSFVHEPHLLEKNQIEGQQLNCTSCHQHETDTKHFEVSEATCHLCHFKNTKFNQGRAKCELCHQLPTKPIKQAEGSDEKEITHKILMDAGVRCGSCHYDLIQGSREAKVMPYFEGGVLKTALIVGAGRINEKNCTTCHDQVKYLNDADKKKMMHEKHVTTKNARCFDCHLPIKHRKGAVNQPLPGDCRACHSDPHSYQRLLAAGPEREGVPALPDRMYKARANCLGCHVERKVTHKGQTVMRASANACVKCHSNDYERILTLWKKEVGEEVEKTQKLEKEALEALAKYKPEITREKLNVVSEMLREGRENLDIVQFGNGVHNPKYSIALLDVAMTRFKEMIDYLEGKDISEGMVQYE